MFRKMSSPISIGWFNIINPNFDLRELEVELLPEEEGTRISCNLELTVPSEGVSGDRFKTWNFLKDIMLFGNHG